MVRSVATTLRRIALAFLFVSYLAPLVAARTWTTRDGKHTVEAELIDVEDGKVILKRDTGKIVRVPIDQLSLVDVRHVQEALAALGRDLKTEQPAPNPPSTPTSTPTEKPLPAQGDSPKAETDAAGAAVGKSGERSKSGRVRKVDDRGTPSRTPDAGPWKYADAPLRPFKLPSGGVTIPVDVHRQTGRLEFPATPSPFVAVRESADSAIFRLFDLRSGKLAGEIREKLSKRSKVHAVALSPDGSLLAVITTDPKPALQIWSFKTGKLAKSPDLGVGASSIRFMEFAGPDRLVTSSQAERGAVFVWNVKSGKLLAQVPVYNSNSNLALSPGGNYVAIGGKAGSSAIHDTRNGNLVGELTAPKIKLGEPAGIAFSRDSTMLATLCYHANNHTKRVITCWSMQNGEQVVEHELKELPNLGHDWGRKLDWLADGSGWYVHGRFIVDRAAGGPVFDFDQEPGHDRTPRRFIDGDNMLEVVGKPGESYLTIVPVPKDKIKSGMTALSVGGTAEDVGLPPLTPTTSPPTAGRPLEPQTAWKYQPAPAELPSSVDLSQQFVFETDATKVRGIHFSAPAAARVIAELEYRAENNKLLKVSYDVYDLAARRRVATFQPPADFILIDVCPQGKLGLFQMERRKDRVDIWDLESGQHVLGFRPDSLVKGHGSKLVDWAAIVSDGQIVTLDKSGLLVGWQIPECRPLYAWQVYAPARATIDALRKTIIVTDRSSKTYILNTATDELLGTLAPAPREVAGKGRWSECVSADGASLAAIFGSETGSAVVEWDLTSGAAKTVTQVPVRGMALAWAGPSHAMLTGTQTNERSKRGAPVTPGHMEFEPGESSLIDLSRGMIVWKYHHPRGQQYAGSPGGTHWYSTHGRPATLVGVALPDTVALQALSKTRFPGPLLTAGQSVSIEIEVVGTIPGSPDAQQPRVQQLRDELKTKLASSFAAQHVKLADDATTQVRIDLREMNPRKIGIQLTKPINNSQTYVAMSPGVEAIVSVRDPSGTVAWQHRQVTQLYTNDKVDNANVPDLEIDDHIKTQLWDRAAQWVAAIKVPVPISASTVIHGLGESELTPGSVRATVLPPEALPEPEPAAEEPPVAETPATETATANEPAIVNAPEVADEPLQETVAIAAPSDKGDASIYVAAGGVAAIIMIVGGYFVWGFARR